MQGLGKIGKKKAFENVRKRLKNDVKRLKIFENIRLFCGYLREFARRRRVAREL